MSAIWRNALNQSMNSSAAKFQPFSACRICLPARHDSHLISRSSALQILPQSNRKGPITLTRPIQRFSRANQRSALKLGHQKLTINCNYHGTWPRSRPKDVSPLRRKARLHVTSTGCNIDITGFDCCIGLHLGYEDCLPVNYQRCLLLLSSSPSMMDLI